MNEENEYSLKKFSNAVKELKAGAKEAKTELEKDGVIQRFEFTFELLWKTLNIHLASKGVQCVTPKDCLAAAFRTGIIQDEKTFLDMLKDRNKTLHIYHKEDSEEIFREIKTRYAPKIEGALTKLAN